MEKKIHIEVIECDCVPWHLDDDSSPEEIAIAEEWWKEIGQHSCRFQAILLDTRFDEPGFVCRIISPIFRRDDEAARHHTKVTLDNGVAEAIRIRTESHPDPV